MFAAYFFSANLAVLRQFKVTGDNSFPERYCSANRAMSPKRWILLLIFYISYLMFGASIYYHIEHSLEKVQREEQLQERIEINEYLMELLAGQNTTTQDEAQYKLGEYCGKPVTAPTSEVLEIPYTWTFYHSFFFVFTVCSTVGYGNLSPSTTLGRMIMIVYSIVGLPVNGILFAGLGEFFGKTFVAIYRRYKKYKLSHNTHYVPLQLGLITTVIIALVPGVVVFVLLPSWLFTFFEGWPYSISVYYSYVTMTTIGFGDFVPTFQPQQPSEFGGWFIVYEIVVIVWMIFSLGYLVMIMTFITRGLQSKRLARLEQQLSSNIKSTQNRIWNGVTKDVGNLRKILNEMYIMRFKPVYTEPDFALLDRRSISCPELSMYRVDSWPESVYQRKRAFSECYDAMEGRATDGTPLVHACSDSALEKIDKQRSFETAEAFRQTTELLAKVVTALATVKPPPPEEYPRIGSGDMYGGYHGFSDSQILASEWSFTSNNPPPKPRGRACSDFYISPMWQVRRPTVLPTDWTWSGDNDQIQDAINKRHNQSNTQNLYRSSFRKPSPKDYVVNMEEDEPAKQTRTKKFSVPDGLRKLFPFRKQSTQEPMVANKNANRKISVMSVPETLQHRAPPLDYYSTVTANASPTYFQNGKPPVMPITSSPYSRSNNQVADNSSSSKLSAAPGNIKYGSFNDPQQPTNTGISTAFASGYQRNAAAANAATRKRRESLFAPNPAITARRASMFPQSSTTAALSQRRGSLHNAERRGSTTSASNMSRRGSLFGPIDGARRSSMFSAASEEDMNVLENTTVADLIRALEIVHTQSVLDETKAAGPPPSTHVGFVDVFSSSSDKKKKRKSCNANIELPDLPQLPPVISLLGGDNAETLTAIAANRLYARRATIVGTSSPLTQAIPNNVSATPNVITRRRKSAVQILDPPPSYSEHEPPAKPAQPPSSSVVSKFKRRFSVRPTSLAIPPGKAPPPGSTIVNATSPTTSTTPTPTSVPLAPMYSSQTALQRRLSLRPSPLARELSIQTQAVSLAPDIGPTSPNGGAGSNAASSTTRLLPIPSQSSSQIARPSSNTTSSTHSPLSRIVQISQAQRKSSAPTDNTVLERAKKSDSK